MTEDGAALLVHLRNVLNNNKGVKAIEGGLSGSVLTQNESLQTGIMSIDDTEGETGGKHGLSFHFRKYLESLVKSDHWDTITQRTLCCSCRQEPANPHVTSCFHIYCLSCLNDLNHWAARRGHDSARCSECGESYTSAQACEQWPTFQARETSSSSDPQPSKKPTKGKKKDGDAEDWIGMKGEVLPSAKTSATKAAILNWLQEDPDVKVIVYTQFLPMVSIFANEKSTV